MTTKHIMLEQLNLDVVPCVGFKVEKITPEDKYRDFGNEKTHYTLTDYSKLNEFPALESFIVLKGNPAFEQAKKIISTKDMYNTNKQYYSLCEKVAKSMGVKNNELSPEQELAQQISNSLQKGQFNDNPQTIVGVKSQHQHYHNMDAEQKKAYSDGSRLSSIKRDMF